jgi:hypothetical protein
MINLKPFRQYGEYDVINGLFSYNGNSAAAGSIVRITSNYKDNSGNNIFDLENMSGVPNTLSAIFSPIGKVETVQNYDDENVIGIILKSVATEDENGNLLIHNTRKAAEMDVVIPTQAVPILTKGIICVNEIDTNDRGLGGGAPSPGDAAYMGNNGSFATDGLVVVGKFLSTIDNDGYAIIKINF